MPQISPYLPQQLSYPQSYGSVFSSRPLPHRLAVIRDVGLAVIISSSVVAANLGVQRYKSGIRVKEPAAAAQTTTPIKAPQQSAPAAPVALSTTPAKPSSADLQAMLDKWQQDYKSAKFGVVIKELDGDKRSASLQADTTFEAASLYKLYLSDYLYTKIAQGRYSLASSLGAGRSLGSCIELMITISDNNCGESIGYNIGWYTLHNFVRNAGFSHTSMVGYNRTSASDVASYLEQLYNGSLLNPSASSDFLSYMKHQIYRTAIPAGVPGVAVADKVGFNFNNWHDAAIVYHPKGNYILAVLSAGSGTGPIRDLSSRINDFMNQ